MGGGIRMGGGKRGVGELYINGMNDLIMIMIII